jgi:phage portal protein BeeE
LKNPFRRTPAPVEKRSGPSFEEWANYFTYNGLTYPLGGSGTIGSEVEEPVPTFTGYVNALMKSNPIVWALIQNRSSAFSEARFKFRDQRDRHLFGTEALAPLEEPTPGETTGRLLTRALQDADIAGNAYFTRQGKRIYRLRPDWVTIVLGSKSGPAEYASSQWDVEPVGYIYQPGGVSSGKGNARVFLPEEVAHFAPIPDPVAAYRGMSWLQPVVRDAMADSLATEHKLKFLEQGGTPNMVVTLSENITDPEVFQQWVDKFEDTHGGVANAFKTLYLAGGTNVEVVGTNLKDADFKAISAQGENRLAVAAGVPAIIAGISEGLDASTYSNFGQARRKFAEETIWPLWREAAGCLSKLIDVPAGTELWIDTTDIAFLQEEAKERAEVQKLDAEALRSLTEAGYTPESAKAAVMGQDLSLLVKDEGLVNHNLVLDPRTAPTPDVPLLPAPSTNGNGNHAEIPA